MDSNATAPLTTLADGRSVIVRDVRDLDLAQLEAERQLVLAALDELVGDERHRHANTWLELIEQAATQLQDKRARVEMVRRTQLANIELAIADHLRSLELLGDAAQRIAAIPLQTIREVDVAIDGISRGDIILQAVQPQ